MFIARAAIWNAPGSRSPSWPLSSSAETTPLETICLHRQQHAGGVLGRQAHDAGGLGDRGEDLARRLALERGAARRGGEPGIGVGRGDQVDAEPVDLGPHECHLAAAGLDAAGGRPEAPLQPRDFEAGADDAANRASGRESDDQRVDAPQMGARRGGRPAHPVDAARSPRRAALGGHAGPIEAADLAGDRADVAPRRPDAGAGAVAGVDPERDAEVVTRHRSSLLARAAVEFVERPGLQAQQPVQDLRAG